MRFLVLDLGIAFENARRLAQDGNQVYYHNFWERAYPKFNEYAVGQGFENVEIIKDFGQCIDEVDVVMFTDIGMGGLADYLKKQGKKVFCPGYYGELLEMDRGFGKDICRQLGIKVSTEHLIRGVTELKERGRDWVDYFLKINTFRGDLESAHIRDYDELLLHLQGIENVLGPLNEQFGFMVEEKVDGVEMGFDVFFNGKTFMRPVGFSIEMKSNVVGVWQEETIGVFEDFLQKMTPYLQEIDYRGYFSTEGIYDGDDFYLIDLTCRPPMPLFVIFAEFVKDFGKLVYDVATGGDNTFDVRESYYGLVNIYSEASKTKWLQVKDKEHLRYRRPVSVGDKIYIVPGDECVVNCLAEGGSWEGVLDGALELASEVEVYQGEYQIGAKEKFVKEYLTPLRELGIVWGE